MSRPDLVIILTDEERAAPAYENDEIRAWRDELAWVTAHVVVDPLERFEGQGTSAIVDFNRDHVASIEKDFIAQSAYLIPSQEGLDGMKRL